MKKILLISLLFLSVTSFGQFAKPANVQPVATYSFFYNPADSTVAMYKGSTFLYNQFWSKHDTVKLKSLATNYKLSTYKPKADSINRVSGYTTLWKLTHKLDSILGLAKLRGDSVVNVGYFTNWKALQYRKLNNHDSLSTLDEKSYNSLTDKPNLNLYRLLNNHDSLSTLDEKAYSSLTGRPDLTIYKEKSDTTANTGFYTNYKATIASYLANDTWTKVYDYAGNLSNFYKLSKDNKVVFAFPIEVGELYTVADAGKQSIANMPVIRSASGDTLQYSIGFAGSQSFKFRALADGSGGFTDARIIVEGKLQQKTGAVNGYYLKSDANGVGTWSAITSTYQGTWSAATNTPTLADGTGTAGFWYRCVAAGTVNFGAGNITFAVGDDVIYSGTVWQRVPAAGYTLQTATKTVLGGVKIDSTSVKYNGSGQLYVKNDYVENATHTGDATGSGALTLVTVNSNVGTYQGITVNGKGLVTAASDQGYKQNSDSTASTGYTRRDRLATELAKKLNLDQTAPQTISNGAPLLSRTPDQITNNLALVNKQYVDLAVSSIKIDEYFTSTASSIGGIYKLMQPTPTAAGTVVSAAITSATTTNVFNFATAAGDPHLDRLLSGNYDVHAHLLKTGTRGITTYCELYKRVLAGTETLLGTSSTSNALTTSDAFYDIYINIATEVPLLTTDRLVLKWYAISDGLGASTTVTMTVGGTADPHFSLAVSGSELDNIFKLRTDSTENSGYASNYKLGLKKASNDSTVNTGYFTNYKASLKMGVLANDQWLKAKDYAGNDVNLLKISKDNYLTFAPKVGINAFNFVLNPSFNYFADIPLSAQGVGITHGTGVRIGGTDALKVYGIGNSSGGIDTAFVDVNTLLIRTGAALNKIAMSEDSRGKVRWSDTKYLFNLTANRILYASAANEMGQLPSGTSGQLLQSAGTSSPAWTTPTYPNTATSGKVLIGNGTNIVLSTPTFPNASATFGKMIKSDGTNWVASTETYDAPGTSGNILRSDGTNWKSIVSPFRLNNDHDSLSTLQEKDYSSLTGKPDLSVYRLLNNHDSLSTLQEKNYSSLDGKPNLAVYRLLNDHDSLSTLQERSYNSLTDKPTITNGTVTSITAGTGLTGGTVTTTGTLAIDTTVVLKKITAASMYQPKGSYQPAGSYQATLSGTGIVKSTAGTISYLTDNSSNWNTAYGWGNHASAGYLTSESDPNIYTWARQATKPTYTYSEVGASSSSHAHGNLSNTGTVTFPEGTVLAVGSSGVLSYKYFGSGAAEVAVGNHDHSGTYVPYSGASGNVNLGAYTITAGDHIMTSSDIRLKTNIKPLTFNSAGNIQAYTYTLKYDPTNKIKYGYIAQEVEKVNPDFVNTDDDGLKTVSYIEILIAKIAELEQRVKILEGKK